MPEPITVAAMVTKPGADTCSCGAILVALPVSSEPPFHALPIDQLTWSCARVFLGLAAPTGHVRPSGPAEPPVGPENAKRFPTFEPGTTVRPSAQFEADPSLPLRRDGQYTVESTHWLQNGAELVRLRGMESHEWFPRVLERVSSPLTPMDVYEGAERELQGRPRERRLAPYPVSGGGHNYLRLYTHEEILREAGRVLTSADFDRLIDRLENL